VLYPPRLRPRASAAGSPFCRSRVLMGTHDGAVHEMERPVKPTLGVCLSLHLGEDSVPDTSALPPVEAARDRLPGVVSLGQDAPGATRAQDPEDTVEDGSVILRGTTRVGLLWWE
jgi:hypothetical protein